MHVCVCACACVYIWVLLCVSAHTCARTLDGVASRGQQRASDPAELEWQVIVNWLPRVPRSELRSSAGAVLGVSHHLPSSLAIPFSIFDWRRVN